MKPIRVTILAIMATWALFFTMPVIQGCATATRTHEAVVYDSFKSTYSAAKTAYMGYLELVVKGQVTKENEAAADRAWNDFRTAFSLAFQAASSDWNAATPEGVQALADQLINLIRTL